MSRAGTSSSSSARGKAKPRDTNHLSRRGRRTIGGGIRLLPNIILAAVVLALFYGLGVLARRLIQSRAARQKRDSLGVVLGGFVKWTVVLVGFLLAATIVIPTLKPGDLIDIIGFTQD